MPHATQLPFEHVLPEAVQDCAAGRPPSVAPPQQAWPMPPHGVLVTGLVHEPVDEQVPLTPVPVHASPTPTHVREAPPPVVA